MAGLENQGDLWVLHLGLDLLSPIVCTGLWTLSLTSVQHLGSRDPHLTKLQLAPFGTFYGSPKPHSRISLGLQERELEWLGEQNTSIRNHIYLHVMICCIRLCALPLWHYPPSPFKIWGAGTLFDKISFRLSYENDDGVNKESEKMLYSRYDRTRRDKLLKLFNRPF